MAVKVERPYLHNTHLLARIRATLGSRLLALAAGRALVENALPWPLGDLIVGCSDAAQLAARCVHCSATIWNCIIVEKKQCTPQTIVGSFTTTGRFVRQTSEPGRLGIVELAFEPCESTGRLALEYVETVEIPKQVKNDDYAIAMLIGIRRAAAEGREFGSPIVNFCDRS